MIEPSSVLEFWFGTKTDMAEINAEKSQLWWGKDSQIDLEITRRFEDLAERVRSGDGYGHWKADPRGCLASIIAVDQFPRNMYRGTPRSFAGDAVARSLAGHLIASGFDKSLSPLERVFAYLPYEHSESLEDQERSVALYRSLIEIVAPSEREMFEGFLDYALRHHEIIERFGRFPHRNDILGRGSSAEEREFLTQDGSSF